MANVTYRVMFRDSGVGTRTGRSVLYELEGETVRLAIQKPTANDPFRFLVHVASGMKVSEQSIDSVMAKTGETETDAATTIFDEHRRRVGDSKMLEMFKRLLVINPSRYT